MLRTTLFVSVLGLLVAAGLPGTAAVAAATATAPVTAPQQLPNGHLVPSVSWQQAPLAPQAQPNAATTDGCSLTRSAPGRPDNVRVNQDCGNTFQAEECVAANP